MKKRRVFIDLRSDFGFKHCLQDEIVMRSFLNAFLEREDKIASVKFENVEMLGAMPEQRGVIFDLLCTTDNGETFLVEMQNSSQKFFKTRANFYMSKLLQKKIKRGTKWGKMKEDISPIIGIFILGEGQNGLHKAITHTAECDIENGDVIWDREQKFYVSLSQFKFDFSNITIKDIYMELLKNLGHMETIDPSVYERADEGLLRLLEKAKVAALTDQEIDQYEAAMKALEDEIDMEQHGFERGVEYAKPIWLAKGIEQGIELGIEQGIEQGEKKNSIKMARLMLEYGKPIEEITLFTGLSKEEIENLR